VAKFRGIQIRDGAIISSHLAEGITVNGITLSGTRLSTKSLKIHDSIGVDGSNVTYNLDDFLSKFGGVISGGTVVSGQTTVSSSLNVASGATFLIRSSLSGADVLQAMSGTVGTTVTVDSLIKLTDGSVLGVNEHSHTITGLGGKEESQLSKIATTTADRITLNFGDFTTLKLPTSTALTSSDIEVYLNGQLLEYGQDSGYTFDRASGIVTFHQAVSGDSLSVVWRSPNPTEPNYEPSYEVNAYPYPLGEQIHYVQDLYTIGGRVADTVGTSQANPANPDGVPDLHFRLVAVDKSSLDWIELHDKNGAFASTRSGSGLYPIRVFTGRVERSLPMTLNEYGTFVFDLYCTPSAEIIANNSYVQAYIRYDESTYINAGTFASTTTALPAASSQSFSNLGDTISGIYSWYVPKRVFSNQKLPFRKKVYVNGQATTKWVTGTARFDLQYFDSGRQSPPSFGQIFSMQTWRWKTNEYDPEIDPTSAANFNGKIQRFDGDTTSYVNPSWQDYDDFSYHSYQTGIPYHIRSSNDWIKFRLKAKTPLSTWGIKLENLSLSLAVSGTGFYNRPGVKRFSTVCVNYPIITVGGNGRVHFKPKQEVVTYTGTDWQGNERVYLKQFKLVDDASRNRLIDFYAYGYLDVYVPTAVLFQYRYYTNSNVPVSFYPNTSGTFNLDFNHYITTVDYGDEDTWTFNPFDDEQFNQFQAASLVTESTTLASKISCSYSSLNTLHYEDNSPIPTAKTLIKSQELEFTPAFSSASGLPIRGFSNFSYGSASSQALPRSVAQSSYYTAYNNLISEASVTSLGISGSEFIFSDYQSASVYTP